MTLQSRLRQSYSEMTLAKFLSQKGGSSGAKYGTESYRAVAWQVVQPIEWEERADASSPTVVRRTVTKFLVMCTETDFVDDGVDNS